MVTIAEQAFHNAVAFHKAAALCSNMIPDPDNENEMFSLSTPEIVCMAFAAELYLKSLILQRGGTAKDEHRLGKLYADKLEDPEREAIARHYEARRGARKERMLRELGAISKAFVQWRYSHEDAHMIDQGALMAFTQSAYLAVRELIPSWAVKQHIHESLLEDAKFTVWTGKFDGDWQKFNRSVNKSLLAMQVMTGKPQPDVIESEKHNFSLTAPTLNLQNQPAAFDINIGRRSDSENGGSAKGGK